MTVSRLSEIPGIGVDRVSRAADAAADPTMLRLENLDTDLRPPACAIVATHAAVDDDACNSYLPFLGPMDLRRAAARRVSMSAGHDYDAESECIVCAGGLNGILNVLLATLEPGDEVIATDPIYAGLINRIRLAGGSVRFVPLIPGPEGWRLDLGALAMSHTPRTRVVLAMSPSMPTGFVANMEEWQALADVCEKRDAWLVYDAAMERIVFDARPVIHPASLTGMAKRVITVGAVSKEYRMIGWRVGWVVGPREIISDVALVGLTNVVCPVGIAMPAARAALNAADDGVAEATREWQARRDCLLDELAGLPLVSPHGGWSLLIDTEAIGMTPGVAAQKLFDVARIAAAPMTGWGPGAARYLRFVYANEPVARLDGIRQRVRRAWSV